MGPRGVWWLRKESAYTSWVTEGAHLFTEDLSVLDSAPVRPICATIPGDKRRQVVYALQPSSELRQLLFSP